MPEVFSRLKAVFDKTYGSSLTSDSRMSVASTKRLIGVYHCVNDRDRLSNEQKAFCGHLCVSLVEQDGLDLGWLSQNVDSDRQTLSRWMDMSRRPRYSHLTPNVRFKDSDIDSLDFTNAVRVLVSKGLPFKYETILDMYRPVNRRVAFNEGEQAVLAYRYHEGLFSLVTNLDERYRWSKLEVVKEPKWFGEGSIISQVVEDCHEWIFSDGEVDPVLMFLMSLEQLSDLEVWMSPDGFRQTEDGCVEFRLTHEHDYRCGLSNGEVRGIVKRRVVEPVSTSGVESAETVKQLESTVCRLSCELAELSAKFATLSDSKKCRMPQPSTDEVARFIKSEGLSVDASRFVDYYTAQRWVLKNGRAMKDWKAAVRLWSRRSGKQQPGQDLF